MNPRLAYGRHRGPDFLAVRDAAVLIALMPPDDGEASPDGWDDHRFAVIRRPATMRHHAGQIALPGGRVEAGETSQAAALREFTEELGVGPRVRQWLPTLPQQFIFGSGFRVVPHVASIESLDPIRPDPAEVDAVAMVRVGDLRMQRYRTTTVLRRSHRHDPRLGWSFRSPAFRVAGVEIWGATAIILKDLVHLLRPMTDVRNGCQRVD